LLLLAYLGCTINQRGSPFGYLYYLLAYVHQTPLFLFLESVVVEEVDGGGDRGSGGNTIFDLQILLEAVLIISLEQPVSFLKIFFLAKKQHFHSWYDYP
jgi:hypothetical protein